MKKPPMNISENKQITCHENHTSSSINKSPLRIHVHVFIYSLYDEDGWIWEGIEPVRSLGCDLLSTYEDKFSCVPTVGDKKNQRN